MNDSPTTGTLLAGDLSLYTLELPWANDAPGISCIPLGRYKTVLAWSDRYGKVMPRLLDVPGRTGILIHTGNTDAETKGCILVGTELHGENLYWSRRAFDMYFEWLARELKDGDVYTTIEMAY